MGSIALPSAEELHLKDSSFDVPTANYPAISVAPLPSTQEELQEIVLKTISDLNSVLQSGDFAQLSHIFASTAYWRDHLGLSNTKLTTVTNASEVIALIQSEGKECNITSFSTSGIATLTGFSSRVQNKVLESSITFQTRTGSGKGLLRIVQDVENGDEWRIYTLFTTLYDLTATPFATAASRPESAKPADVPGTTNWFEWRESERNFVDKDPQVLIVGAGHSGLMMAARLKMLGVSSLVVDKQLRTGDSWRTRYHDLVLHDPCWMNAMPYLAYPPTWPILTPKDKMADFLAYYETALDLNLWNSTRLVSSVWDGMKKEWTAVLDRTQNGEITRRTLHPHHIIQATGLNGEPRMPTIPGMASFTGPMLHSTQFNNGSEFAGKKVVVVGTGTSGHDIAQGLYKRGAEVTIVQRSPTFTMSLSSVHKMIRGRYNEDANVDDADILMQSTPTTLFKRSGSDGALLLAPLNQPTWDALESVGYRTVQSKIELPSLLPLTIHRAGGFYIDIGCGSLIASRKIAVKSAPYISHLTPSAVVFPDGEEVQADAVIFATGYSNGKVRTRKVFGDSVADKIAPIWGFDEQGEIRGCWKRGGQEGFWVAAGSFWLSRYYSRLLALQIKMVEEGLVGF